MLRRGTRTPARPRLSGPCGRRGPPDRTAENRCVWRNCFVSRQSGSAGAPVNKRLNDEKKQIKTEGGIVILTKSQVKKSGSVTAGGNFSPDEASLEKINRFTRRDFSAEELYVFPVVLCDNEVDRDGERFSAAALEALSALFVGKTGIFNHSGKAQDQTARIYDCRVERDPEKITKSGEPYARLRAEAYLPRTERNGGLIAELESGIKKEVSVGCAVRRVTCSVCGADLREGPCEHERGKIYGGILCCAVLDEPTDAYEWSFVAVPSQPAAGVIKSFGGKGGIRTQDVMKAIRSGGEITLSAEQAAALAADIDALEREAACGRAYRTELKKEFVRCAGLSRPDIPVEALGRAADGMELEDLKCFAAAFRREAERKVPLSPQLAGAERKTGPDGNSPFRI